jgi:hypothetical protein
VIWPIKDILDQPDFDLLDALQVHKETLQKKAEQLNGHISIVNHTILHESSRKPGGLNAPDEPRR